MVSDDKIALKQMVQEAISRDPVQLSSGAFSDFYIDGRRVTLDAAGAHALAVVMGEMLAGLDFVAVGGPTMGADPIVGALLYHLHAVGQVGVAGFIVRKEVKGHGLQRLIEGPALPPGAPVVMVEDVVTSGGSVLKAIKAAEESGLRVVKVLALVDREAGAAQALGDYDFSPVFTRSELE